ncbi:hypothetical protein LCGC14_1112740 [marine sediment metagenome]|uniref:Uncharacterized protein n=1 Tax=marine sediment metagenome TaxID=412755 RepID=A0A0F9PPD0_9ZZZZ
MIIPSTHRHAFLTTGIGNAPGLGLGSALGEAPTTVVSAPSGMTVAQIDVATATFDQTKAPDTTSIDSMTDFIQTYLQWIDFQFAMIDQQYQAMKFFQSLGVASCDDLTRYNSMAKEAFFAAELIRRRLKDADVPNLPMVPRPGMFGHTAEEFIDFENNIVDVRVVIDCSGDGYPKPGLRVNPFAPKSGGPLGIAMFAPVVAAPLIWGGALILGGLAAWLVGAGIAKILRAFPGTVAAQLTADMHNAALAGDAKRADLITNCLADELAKLSPEQQQDISVRRRVFIQCQQHAQAVIPNRKPPKLPTGGWGIGKTILYAGLGIGAIFLSVGAYRMWTARTV